jgi:hypothetical protein
MLLLHAPHIILGNGSCLIEFLPQQPLHRCVYHHYDNCVYHCTNGMSFFLFPPPFFAILDCVTEGVKENWTDVLYLCPIACSVIRATSLQSTWKLGGSVLKVGVTAQSLSFLLLGGFL